MSKQTGMKPFTLYVFRRGELGEIDLMAHQDDSITIEGSDIDIATPLFAAKPFHVSHWRQEDPWPMFSRTLVEALRSGEVDDIDLAYLKKREPLTMKAFEQWVSL